MAHNYEMTPLVLLGLYSMVFISGFTCTSAETSPEHVLYKKEPAWIKCGEYKSLRAQRFKKAFTLTKAEAVKYPDEYKFASMVVRDRGMNIVVMWKKRTNETIDEPYLTFAYARWYRTSGVSTAIKTFSGRILISTRSTPAAR